MLAIISSLGLQPLDPALLTKAQEEIRTGVRVEEGCSTTWCGLAQATRESPALSLGASPRAVVFLMQAAKAKAAMDARDYVIPDDVKNAALPVLPPSGDSQARSRIGGLAAQIRSFAICCGRSRFLSESIHYADSGDSGGPRRSPMAGSGSLLAGVRFCWPRSASCGSGPPFSTLASPSPSWRGMCCC